MESTNASFLPTGYCWFKSGGETIKLPTSMGQLLREAKAGRDLAAAVKEQQMRGEHIAPEIAKYANRFEAVVVGLSAADAR